MTLVDQLSRLAFRKGFLVEPVSNKKDLINSLVDTLKDKVENEDQLEDIRSAVFEREA